MMNAKIKIAFLESSHIFSGAEMSLHSLITYLDPEMFESYIYFTFPMEHQKRYNDLQCKKEYLADAPKWWMGSDRWKKPLRGSDFLKRMIVGIKFAMKAKNEGIDIIHINLINPKTFWCVWWSKLFGIKVVGHSRSDTMHWIPAAKLQKLLDAVICVSDFVKEKVLVKYPQSPAFTVYDPVDFNYYRQGTKLEAYDILDIDKSKRLLSSVGLLSTHKGHDMAIRVFARLANEFLDIILLVAGGGSDDELKRLKKLAQDLGVNDRVLFTEKQIAYVDKVYRASDLVFSLTTRGEAFGRVPFEALACETAVIAPAKGAAVELITDGENGFMVDPLNEDAIYEKVLSILKHPSETKEVVKRGIDHFEQKLSPLTSATMVQKIYLSLMEQKTL